jgi:hypothetical protein
MIVSTTLKEVLNTLRGDVDFKRKDILGGALEDTLDTLVGDMKFQRKCVSLCRRGGNTHKDNFKFRGQKIH